MDRTGLLAKIYDGVSAIDQGRKWLDTDGIEHEGRIIETTASEYNNRAVGILGNATKNIG